MISFQLMISEIVWRNSFILCLQSTWDISDFDWSWCWSWSCSKCEKLMIGWDWMKKWEMLEFWDGWFLSNNLSYQHPSFFIQNIWKLNYLPSHLLSSIVRFDFIFRLEKLLSWKHQIIIKLKLQRCWWKLELIHSWEI